MVLGNGQTEENHTLYHGEQYHFHGDNVCRRAQILINELIEHQRLIGSVGMCTLSQR